MKIVAHVSGRYLVEMDEEEIAVAMGYSSTYGEYRTHTKGLRSGPGHGDPIRIGAVILPVSVHAALRDVLSKEDKIKEAAATLRALAGLMDRGLPSAFIPPPETEAPAAQAETGADLT